MTEVVNRRTEETLHYQRAKELIGKTSDPVLIEHYRTLIRDHEKKLAQNKKTCSCKSINTSVVLAGKER